MALKIKKTTEKTAQKSSFVPYEKEHELRPLKLFIISVPYGQATPIQKILNEYETSISLFMSGEGCRFKSRFEMMNTNKKSILFAVVREDKAEVLKRRLEERINISKASQGYAIILNITSVAGVTIYKFLSNTRKVTKVSKNGKHSSK